MAVNDPADQEEFSKARNKAFKLLSYRERTISEMKTKLEKKDFSPAVIESVIDYLLAENYLNEARFAEMWIRSRVKHHPRGRRLIYKELSDKGLDRELINQALSQYLSSEIETEMAVELKEKWLRRRKEEDESSYKLKNYLARKGFTNNIIFKVTEK